MSTVRDMLREAATRIGNPDARREAEILLAFVLGRDRGWLIAHADDAIAADAGAAFDVLARRRANGEPVAYLTGSREFWSLPLEVTADVLVPRAETELLVELALARIPTDRPVRIADLGTGSGAIALAIASARTHAQIVATDVSASAVEVARRNAKALDLRNVEFRVGSWFEPVSDCTFDVVVSNPPYIAAGDAHLGDRDLRYEPPVALSSGPDGLDAIRILVRDAPRHLAPSGWLLFEHGFEQGDANRALLVAAGLVKVFTHHDLEYRDRVSGGRMPTAS
jgi:release factor glutamine methyltransferase